MDNTDDVKKFAKEISENLYAKTFYKSKTPSQLCDAVRQMIEHKLKKENWVKN